MADSWWLKVKRAQKHMVDVRDGLRVYSDGNPYEVVKVRETKRQPNRRRYTLNFTEQPDPMLVTVLADFVHNLRSALDQIVVACSEPKYRKTASFPISYTNIWESDLVSGEFVSPDKKARERFAMAIRGLSDGARKAILAAQPYWLGDDAGDAIVGIMSRLENADKHRELITVSNVVEAPVVALWIDGEYIPNPKVPRISRRTYFEEGTIIVDIAPGDTTRQAKVKVECSGTAVVAIKVQGVRGESRPENFPVRKLMVDSLQGTRRILRSLEPFVK